MAKRLMVVVTGLIFGLGLVSDAHAQVTLDVSKVTCEQYVGYKITDPQNIAIWLSGYYSGKRGTTSLDTQAVTEYARKLQDYCIRNPQVPVMQAVEGLLGAGR